MYETVEAIQADIQGFGKVLYPIFNGNIPERIDSYTLYCMGHLRKFENFNPNGKIYRYQYNPFQKSWYLS